MDLTKAYDSVDRDTAWRVLELRGADPKLVQLLRELHLDTTCFVRAFGDVSPPFSIGTGFKQGCVLASGLFNLFIDTVARQLLVAIRDLGICFEYKLDGHLTRLNKWTANFKVIIFMLMYADIELG